MNCQLAVVYIKAMNVFEKFLKSDHLQAVVGGHSKRGEVRRSPPPSIRVLHRW